MKQIFTWSIVIFAGLETNFSEIKITSSSESVWKGEHRMIMFAADGPHDCIIWLKPYWLYYAL